MNNMQKILSKWNFKKIAIAYIIVAVVAAVACCACVGVVFKERIAVAWQYSQVSDAAQKQDVTKLKSEIDKLAASSNDITDVMILDDKNHVTYSAKKSDFANGIFNLEPDAKDENYLVSDKNSSVVFKYVDSKEFMLASVLNNDFEELKDEYDSKSFYEQGFNQKTVNMLSYIKCGDNDKVYVLSAPTSVSGGMLTLKIAACVLMLFFMVYWVLVALWAYQNAKKHKLNGLFWGIIVLFTNVVGAAVYLLYKNGNTTCSHCSTSQSRQHIYCSNCGEKIGITCSHCGAPVTKNDKYCTVCGKEIK